MNLIQSEFSEREIRVVLLVGGSKISQLRKVLQDGIDTLHTRCPSRVPAHALHDNNLDMIKAHAESWEVEDGFPCAHRRPKQYLLDPKLMFTKLYQRYKDKINPPMTVVVLYRIHTGFNTSTYSFLAFAWTYATVAFVSISSCSETTFPLTNTITCS